VIPGARHGIADLAGHAGLSPRHLQCRFTAEIGTPPYVERVRIEAAQRALADSDHPVATIARRYGFGTADPAPSVPPQRQRRAIGL
jgi:transcriptional regulator GlxA family with amidase domain